MSRNEQVSIALLALSLKSAEPFVNILPTAYEDVSTALMPYVALESPPRCRHFALPRWFMSTV